MDTTNTSSGSETHQRAIIYAGVSPARRRRPEAAALSVPNWFDLPLLLPEPHPVAARVQRVLTRDDERSAQQQSLSGSHVPKISRLSPVKDLLHHKASSRAALAGAASVQHLGVRNGPRNHAIRQKKRITTHAGAPVVLDRIDRKSRLKEKIWKDLNRFGLWYVAGETAMDGAVDSLDRTADAIMQQWEDATMIDGALGARELGNRLGSHTASTQRQSATTRIEDCNHDDFPTRSKQPETLSPVFMTALPDSSALMESRQTNFNGPEEDDDEEVNNDNDDGDEGEEDEESDATTNGVRRDIRPPGMKRRQRLKELHYFVEKQLQKRLFKSWDTIEIAFTGSGDLTVSQIVKFLQHSDVQLSASDASKVQAILEKHTRDNQANQEVKNLLSTIPESNNESENTETSIHQALAGKSKSKPNTLSFSAFSRIFRTKDNLEAQKWKREFDREKIRQRHEKEIYEKELAALEEKVKKRLAESAKVMIDILAQFRVDPRAIPWENNEQRLEMRAQLFETIFAKPHRRQLLQTSSSSPESDGASLPGGSNIPEKLSARIVESALLQKYSRNGHFDLIEAVPAAYVFHDFVTDCIKKSFERYWQKCEADQWPERQLIFQFRLKKQVFYEWRRFTKHAETLRRFVMRKFVAWKYMTRKLHEHYQFVRVTFWPFYVWKRHLQQQIIARGKSSFLKNVVLTYIQLRHFRALKARYLRKQWNKRQTARLLSEKASKLLQVAWDEWKSRTEARIVIHRLWKSHGHVLQRLHKFYMVRVTFYIWSYFAILKKDLQRRKYRCFFDQLSPVRKQRTQAANVQDDWVANGQTNESNHALSNESESQGLVGTNSIGAIGGSSLTRIMETELGQKIKRKSRLYDLCLALYLKYREKDRREMVGNVITFRKVARKFMVLLKRVVEHEKKNRFASDLGGFRILRQRFQQWMLGTFFKEQLGLSSDDIEPSKDNNEEEDFSGDDVDSTGRIVLHWRRDREWRQLAIEENPSQAQRLREDLRVIFENNSRRAELVLDREAAFMRKHQTEEAFLRKEAGATLKVRSTQMQQSQLIMRTRGHRMHDVLDRVYDDLLRQHTRRQLKSSFRSIRVLVMMKYTETLCHRAQLRNWLRLCHRFLYWERHMEAFWRAKTQYHVFQTLLKHAVWKWKFQTPGLSRKLQQRRELVYKYEQFLEHHRLLDGSLASSRLAFTKFSPANSFHGLFFRWVQFAQFQHAANRMVLLVREKKEFALVQSVFHALKLHVKGKYTFEERLRKRPFLLRQVEADLDAYHCKLISLRARLPTTQLRKKLALKRAFLLNAATGSPTLKQLFQEHEEDVRRRLALENRLMFTAYNERKIHNYAERSSPLFGAAVGRSFAYERAPPFGSIGEVAITCGKKVDGISLVVKTSASVTHEGALHGNPFGTRDVFVLAKGEVLVSIEGFASQTVFGLRFGTSTGRHSKWYGHCDKGTRFEIRSDFAGKREEIVGLFGYADGTSLHALGAVFRHTTFKNIFEGLWLQNESQPPQQRGASDEVALCDRQFSYFLQVRTCDVLNAMKRAHRFARRAHRAPLLPSALSRIRIMMGLARWFFDALTHGLVHNSTREEEGKRVLQDGMNKRAAGERSLQEALATIELVDSFRDEDRQLSVATLGAKKVAELREALEQAQQRAAFARQQLDEGQAEILAGRRILPHLPMTRRMLTAVRRIYRVVQTKDYIDQMDPDVRAILLEGDGSTSLLDLENGAGTSDLL